MYRKNIFIFTDFSNSTKLSATFYNPVLDEQIRQDNNGKEKVEFGYIFPKGSVSLCGRFQLTYFCPAIIQMNCLKTTLKLWRQVVLSMQEMELLTNIIHLKELYLLLNLL